MTNIYLGLLCVNVIALVLIHCVKAKKTIGLLSFYLCDLISLSIFIVANNSIGPYQNMISPILVVTGASIVFIYIIKDFSHIAQRIHSLRK